MAFLLVLGSVQGEDGSGRVLTDLEGRTIEVRILAVDEESVVVVRGDGREFDIPLAKLSEEDREYLKTWKSPWKGGLESPVDGVVIVETSSGIGTGFFAFEGGRVYLYTNQHVIDDLDGLKITDSRGAQVRTLGLEISRSQDLARFRVHPRKAFPLSDRIEPGEELTVLGNSEGAGVITHSTATVNGIGPDEIEVDSDFVPGNSGGPLLNSENEVVGVATYAIRGEERPDWVKEGTRYTEPRRFTIRPSRVNDWERVSISEYTSQIGKLKEAWRHFSRSYWTYYALAEWEGYISTIPDHWERPLRMILRNHNSRQKKPDYDTRYEQDGSDNPGGSGVPRGYPCGR